MDPPSSTSSAGSDSARNGGDGHGGEGQSENERLISAIQACFDRLNKQNDEQSDKLHKAVEAIRPKLPTMDKKTMFWNEYKILAEEFDHEFQMRYGNDLDTALIFAGLFSAVSSAFIIQIQPNCSRIRAMSPKLSFSFLSTVSIKLLFRLRRSRMVGTPDKNYCCSEGSSLHRPLFYASRCITFCSREAVALVLWCCRRTRDY
ncbi:hypothetical protein B0H10DRAFT_2442765 [Mycena sp. CBHHK59/15]|nr:hypothetical protein B0H10DRAFT_2442765 [Mycena sp. CBHHK59/15]